MKSKQLHEKLKALEKLVITDELTGLYNYRFFRKVFTKELYRARRYSRLLALLIIDIKNFKKLNDTKGHIAGNKILKKVATILSKNIRKSDILSRYGGDEFTIILPEASREHALIIAIGLREHVLKKVGIKLDIGASAYPQNGDNRKALFEYADRKMYKCKWKSKIRGY